MSRKTTKIAEFCSWVGQHQRGELLHQADGEPAPERADDAAHAAQHHAGVHHDHVLQPDEGMERIVGGEQPAGERGDRHAEREGDAVRAVDVDAHVGRGERVVGGGAQQAAEARAVDEQADQQDARHRDQRGDGARLVEEHADVAAQRDLPGRGGERRAQRGHHRAEDHLRAVGQHQRDAQGEDELRVVPLALQRRGARARDARDQQRCGQVADSDRAAARRAGSPT